MIYSLGIQSFWLHFFFNQIKNPYFIISLSQKNRVNMKKILPLLLILLVASAFKNEDDILPSPLLGTWQMLGVDNYLDWIA